MPLIRLLLAAAVIFHAGAAGADERAIAANAQEVTVAVGVGTMTTAGSAGEHSVAGLSLSGSWFPDNGRLGARLHLAFAWLDRGTTYVHSERRNSQVIALATARHHVAGPLYLFAGAGGGAVITRSRHRALADVMTVWTTNPAVSWSAGVELVVQQVFVRADHVGVGHQASRDMLYSVHVGMAF